MSAQSNQIAVDAAAAVGTRYYRAPFMNAAAIYDWSNVQGILNNVGANDANAVEVVSFGESLQEPALAAVTRTTLSALRQQGHYAVKYVSPPWCQTSSRDMD